MAKKTPYTYQETAIQKILDEPTRAALVASEVGRGKTLVASECIIRAGWDRVLLIGIKHTLDQWADTISDQSDGQLQVRWMHSDNKAGLQAAADFLDGKDGIFFATIQWLQSQDWTHVPSFNNDGTPKWRTKKVNGEDVIQCHPLKEGHYGPAAPKRVTERRHLRTFAKMSARKDSGVDAIIFDEAHAVASHTSIGRKTLVNIKGRRGFKEAFKIALSATWSGNSFENAWSAPRWLWPDNIPAYWEWRSQWVQMGAMLDENGQPVYAKDRNGVPQAVLEVKGEKEPQGTFVKTLPCYILDKSDMPLPEPQRIYVDMTPEQAAQYEEFEQDLMTWVMNYAGDERPIVAEVPGALHMRLKQVALGTLTLAEDDEVVFDVNTSSGKLKALAGMLKHLGDQPAMIYVPGSKGFAKAVTARMAAAGERVESWTGDTSSKERKRIKADFMAGRVQYIVATPESIGTGTDGLQNVCSAMIWLAVPDGQPVLETQGVGRLNRPGVTTKYGPVKDYRVIARGTTDERKLENLIAQAWANRRSLDNAA